MINKNMKRNCATACALNDRIKSAEKCRLITKPMSLRLMLIFTFTIILTFTMSAQILEDAETNWEDIPQVRSQPKSAGMAILLSTVFPGSGHIYANPRSAGTYIFPLLEIGLWVGYFHYSNKGDQIEKDYMAYADNNYVWDHYIHGRDNLANQEAASSIYKVRDDNTGELIHFRLDPVTDPQHYYEDIGKYNKYIFGWKDWHETYVNPETGEIKWRFNEPGMWLGNWPWDSDPTGPYDRPYSSLRAKYIRMRRDAQEHHDISYLMSFGLALNRIASALDAVRVTNRYNREYRYSYNFDFDFNVSPILTDSGVTPTLNLVIRY